jgi:hypothetical protein
MLIEQIPIVLSVFACIISLYSVYKALIMPKLLQDNIETAISHYEEELETYLKPIQEKVKKSYSQLGKAGASVRQKQALDARITQDVISLQDPLIQGALELFPNVREYVDKNPHMLMELLPRLKELQKIDGFKIGDLISPSSPNNPSNPSKHPYGRLEE